MYLLMGLSLHTCIFNCIIWKVPSGGIWDRPKLHLCSALKELNFNSHFYMVVNIYFGRVLLYHLLSYGWFSVPEMDLWQIISTEYWVIDSLHLWQYLRLPLSKFIEWYLQDLHVALYIVTEKTKQKDRQILNGS